MFSITGKNRNKPLILLSDLIPLPRLPTLILSFPCYPFYCSGFSQSIFGLLSFSCPMSFCLFVFSNCVFLLSSVFVSGIDFPFIFVSVFIYLELFEHNYNNSFEFFVWKYFTIILTGIFYCSISKFWRRQLCWAFRLFLLLDWDFHIWS